MFPREEFDRRLEQVRARMEERHLDGLLVASPENVYYLTGLDHQGYFAYELLVLPLRGQPILVTRAMESATVRDLAPGVRHAGYTDGSAPLPSQQDDAEQDLVLSSHTEAGEHAGLRPWSMSYGVPTRDPQELPVALDDPLRVTLQAIGDAGLASGRLGLEMASSFLPYRIARDLVGQLPEADVADASGLVDDCRIVQSPLELERTRRAANITDAMMLAGIASAGAGIHKRDVVAAVYDAMFRRGGTYPGFVPLVRSTRTLQHEHGTWHDNRLKHRDILFLEFAACVQRYHAPMGRLVFVGRAPSSATRIHEVCSTAIERAQQRIGPGIPASEVYAAWHACLEQAGLGDYHRHHCGYSVGIGFPPSWSGSGVPLGLRPSSSMRLRPGMVFHLMSWLLRTGRGDSFISDTVVVTEQGCEALTTVPRQLYVRS